MLLSDLFAIFFMYKKDIESTEKSLLDELLYANTQRFHTNEDTNESYNLVQIKTMIFHRMAGNDNFTNKYVAYAREIYEVSIAFFIGYEIGYHYYEHTNPSVKSSQDVKIKEYMADDYGVNFAITYLQSLYANDDNRYGIYQFAGIDIPLIASSYFCDDILLDGETHPAIAKRFCKIQKYLKIKIEKKAYQEVENYIGELYKTIKFDTKVNE